MKESHLRFSKEDRASEVNGKKGQEDGDGKETGEEGGGVGEGRDVAEPFCLSKKKDAIRPPNFYCVSGVDFRVLWNSLVRG